MGVDAGYRGGHLGGFGTATVTGNLTVAGTATVTGATLLSSTLEVDGAANFDGTADFDGAVDMSANLTLSAGTLDVSAATVTGVEGRWQLGPIMAINLAANQTDSTSTSYTTGLGAALRVWKAQRACSVTGISFYMNTVNGTPAGTVTFSVFKNGSDAGSDYDLALTPSGASDQGPASKTYSSALSVAANDTIDLRWTTTADWNSTTGDIVVFLEMEQASV